MRGAPTIAALAAVIPLLAACLLGFTIGPLRRRGPKNAVEGLL